MSSDSQQGMFVIKRDPPKKCISPQYEEYRSMIDKRRRRVSNLFQYLQRYLNSLPGLKKKADMIRLAVAISRELNIKLDRDAKRVSEALICWYCENWIKICTVFPDIYLKEIISQGDKQSKNSKSEFSIDTALQTEDFSLDSDLSLVDWDGFQGDLLNFDL